IGALIWIVAAFLFRWTYIRLFPKFSSFAGYGEVVDKLPSRVEKSPFAVNYYSFLGCPFCPIVLQRLESLQKQMDFTLNKIDVTLNPQILAAKGIRSVPVVEVGDKRLIGNSTTDQLASLIASGGPRVGGE